VFLRSQVVQALRKGINPPVMAVAAGVLCASNAPQ
jgi:hypothetical protein